MNATWTRLVFDQSGNLVMIVKPDSDAQLQDRAFGPNGTIVIDLPSATYAGCARHLDILTIAQPLVAAANPAAGISLQQKIDAITAIRLGPPDPNDHKIARQIL